MAPHQKKVNQPIDQLQNLADATLVGSYLNKKVTNSGNDYSLNGNDATAVNAVTWNRVGGDFDGATSRINVPFADYAALTTGTIEMWINMETAPGAGTADAIFGVQDSGDAASYAEIAVYNNGGNLKFLWSVYEAGAALVSGETPNASLVAGRWIYVVLTVGAAGNKIYINGADQTITYGTGSAASTQFFDDVNNVDSAIIGSSYRAAAYSNFFDGKIKGLNIHSEVKSADWVGVNFSKGVPDNALMLDILDGSEDLSRIKNTLTVNTGTIIGNNMDFDGVSGRIDVPYAPFASLASGTISFWMNTRSAAVPAELIWEINDSGDPVSFMGIGTYISGADLILAWWVYEGGLAKVFGATQVGALSFNQFFHMVLSVGSSGNTIYINGIAQTLSYTAGNASSTFFIDDVNDIDNAMIGATKRTGAVQRWWDGILKDFRIYNEAKSAGWALAEYNRTRKYY